MNTAETPPPETPPAAPGVPQAEPITAAEIAGATVNAAAGPAAAPAGTPEPARLKAPALVADDMPTNPATGRPWTAAEVAAVPANKFGTAFNPRKHMPPPLDKAGRFKNRGVGRKARQMNLGPFQTPTTAPKPQPAPPVAEKRPKIAPPLVLPAAGTPPPANGQETPRPAEILGEDPSQAQAEATARLLYAVTGTATGAPEEATRTGAAHSNMRDALAAWMKQAGIRFSAGWMFIFTILLYVAETFQKPKSREVGRTWLAWMHKKPAPVNVTATAPAAPATAEPKPTPTTSGIFDHLEPKP